MDRSESSSDPWRMHLTLFVVLAILLTGATISTANWSAPVEHGPLPFDPPSPQEQDLAIETVFEDLRERTEIAQRSVALGVALRTQKDPGVPPADHPRLFDVWFYDYDKDQVVWAVYDSARGEVQDLLDIPDRLYLPLSAAEAERAMEFAEGEAALRGAEKPVRESTLALVQGEGTACPENRCALVTFLETRSLKGPLYVLVNLSQDRVQRVVEDGNRQEAVLE